MKFNQSEWESDLPKLQTLLPSITERVTYFKNVPSSLWAREILFCILTPQSSPFRAENALVQLEKNGLFAGALSVDHAAAILKQPEHYIRFHNVKAKRIVELASVIQNIIVRMMSVEEGREEREILVDSINGFGLKEASHALRNIGRTDLAILDRHILRNLVRLEIINSVPSSLNKKHYLEIEKRFIEFGKAVGFSIDVLDLYFWCKQTGKIFK